jgi:hypothetical protein
VPTETAAVSTETATVSAEAAAVSAEAAAVSAEAAAPSSLDRKWRDDHRRAEQSHAEPACERTFNDAIVCFHLSLFFGV